MQKTLTINGVKFNSKQIAKLMTDDNMTNGEDYLIVLNGKKYYANFRQLQGYYAPVCEKNIANAISLMSSNGPYIWNIWLSL